ncbi:MAG TPA: phosphoglycerate mutase family protein [Myxococcales bacterium]|nr:phosphoglycerate mutase family protein [Myxococcales bacterium]
MMFLLALLQVLFLVRHAEKVDNSKDAALSAAGEARAQALAGKLADARIGAIFATQYKRTQQTAAPVAEKLKLKMQVHEADDTAGLVKLLEKEDRALVVGHANTLSEIAKAFGVTLEVSDDDFGGLYVMLPREKLLIKLRQ